mmetsp:Transcript_16752/g.63701  ORF Transcript_16752/g.63701 Transcript_16752/m.63701 type:complete len:253 (-) Transcript_16752:1769-2527(-)
MRVWISSARRCPRWPAPADASARRGEGKPEGRREESPRQNSLAKACSRLRTSRSSSDASGHVRFSCRTVLLPHNRLEGDAMLPLLYAIGRHQLLQHVLHLWVAFHGLPDLPTRRYAIHQHHSTKDVFAVVHGAGGHHACQDQRIHLLLRRVPFLLSYQIFKLPQHRRLLLQRFSNVSQWIQVSPGYQMVQKLTELIHRSRRERFRYGSCVEVLRRARQLRRFVNASAAERLELQWVTVQITGAAAFRIYTKA